MLILSILAKNYFILYIVKQLYFITKAGNYWSRTYSDHHKEKLDLDILSYNSFLLIIKDKDKNFGIIRLQTDNIFNTITKAIMNKKQAKIIEAKFKAKLQTMLKTSALKNFNVCRITIEDKAIMVTQKN